MADVTLPRSNANNGTATPATPGSITVVNPDLVVLIIAALGTSPTIATPASFTQVQKTSGAALSFAMYAQPNAAAGATNPSSALGGTITGWLAAQFEFTAAGANCQLQGSNQQTSAVAQLTNVFPNGQIPFNALFCYAVARATATITAQNTGLAPLPSWTVPLVSSEQSLWSASVQGQAGVQGLSLDFYWGSSLAMGPGPFPSASGLLGSAVNSVQIGAWFNTIAQQPQNGDVVSGNAGIYVPSQYAGSIGG